MNKQTKNHEDFSPGEIREWIKHLLLCPCLGLELNVFMQIAAAGLAKNKDGHTFQGCFCSERSFALGPPALIRADRGFRWTLIMDVEFGSVLLIQGRSPPAFPDLQLPTHTYKALSYCCPWICPSDYPSCMYVFNNWKLFIKPCKRLFCSSSPLSPPAPHHYWDTIALEHLVRLKCTAC